MAGPDHDNGKRGSNQSQDSSRKDQMYGIGEACHGKRDKPGKGKAGKGNGRITPKQDVLKHGQGMTGQH